MVDQLHTISLRSNPARRRKRKAPKKRARKTAARKAVRSSYIVEGFIDGARPHFLYWTGRAWSKGRAAAKRYTSTAQLKGDAKKALKKKRGFRFVRGIKA